VPAAGLKDRNIPADEKGRILMRPFATFMVCLLAPGGLHAARVSTLRLGADADEAACAIRKRTERFETSQAQAFVQFDARGLRRGDRLSIEWITPGGEVGSSAPYEGLPAGDLCFVSALPIGGFEPASQPGRWRVRVSVNGAPAAEREFEITGDPRVRGLQILKLSRGLSTLDLETHGAHSETSVNLAKYTPGGGWTYVAQTLPEGQDGARLRVKIPPLDPAEYIVILRNPDGALSAPKRLVIETDNGYHMPVLAGESWRITQGPYGSFSHWGKTQHAFDIAPVNGSRWVAAMRPGKVFAHDLGLGQTPRRRIFGNYITLQHEGGEYSHYAHLRAGSFLVKSGETVRAGQPLAEVGNSGYSFGRHLHVQVTREFRIASPSVPFRFGGPAERAPADVSRAPGAAPRWRSAVAFAQWWSEVFQVPKGAKALRMRLGWEDAQTGFEMRVTSPSGREFVVEGDARESLQVAGPEPGAWRVSVQAVRGNGASLPFWVEQTVN
jgi:murein DD-endopeptidase MepM/ murein hydrolase activator NlpD